MRAVPVAGSFGGGRDSGRAAWMLHHSVGRSSYGSWTPRELAWDIHPPKTRPDHNGARMYRAYRPDRGAHLRLDALSFDDSDASRGHRPSDLLDRDPEDRGEFLGDALAVALPRSEDDIPCGFGCDGGDWSAHDPALTFDLDLPHGGSDGQAVRVDPLSPREKESSRQELAGLRLLRHLFRQDPVCAPARESRGPCLAVREGELARLPQRDFCSPRAILDHRRRGAVDVGVSVPV